MKICYLWAHRSSSAVGNTAPAVHTQSMCQAFKRLGHNVFIVSGELKNNTDFKIEDSPIPLFLIPSPKPVPLTSWIYQRFGGYRESKSTSESSVDLYLPSIGYEAKWRQNLVWGDLEQRISIWRYQRHFYHRALTILKQERPDALYERYNHYGVAGIFLAKYLGIPLILEMNASGTQPREWYRHKSPFYPLMNLKTERYLCRNATAVIVVSNVLKSYLNNAGINKNRIVVLPNAVDLELFHPDEQASMFIRKKYGLVDKFVVGFVGAMRPWHYIATFIEGVSLVAQNYPDIHVIIVGDGPSQHSLQCQSKELGLDNRITFVGSVPHNEIPGYIGSMDVTVCLSTSIDDYFSPMKIFEYMAMSKPVIASQNGQMSEIIQNEQNGILVKPEDAKQVANAILELAKKPDLRNSLGQAARKTVESRYTWEHNAKLVLDIYKRNKDN